MVECMLHMHMSDGDCPNFETKFLLRRGECKTREISNLWKNGKIVISFKNPKFIL